ncbi:MAG: HRDC domain-containing protein [Candidatus Omnitrophica bacterium]|nr:HRDC domain-containing protein [Candidatus Omnitrophota bacterium]
MEQQPNMKVSSGYTFVNTAESLAGLTETMKSASRVAFDMEADGLHHYFEKVCLMQLSFSGANYIVDPLAGLELKDFLEVLAQKELIIHAADFDLRMLKKTFGFRPNAPVFDTMLAAQVLGFEKIGLAALVEKYFAVILPKTAQKSDWSRRPLPVNSLNYASDDTKYLEAIADTMTESLQQLGRMSWHQECCARVVENTGIVPDKDETKEAWRVKGSSRLAPNVLVYVRELWKWRDEEARKRDRPAFMIMNNEDLVAFAEWRAANLQGPIEQRDSNFLRRYDAEVFSRLKNAILAADRMPASEWPVLPKRQVWPAAKSSIEKLEPLMAACKTLADELKIEACFLASRATLTAVVQHKALTIESAMAASGMMKWQAELMMPKIQSLLA